MLILRPLSAVNLVFVVSCASSIIQAHPSTLPPHSHVLPDSEYCSTYGSDSAPSPASFTARTLNSSISICKTVTVYVVGVAPHNLVFVDPMAGASQLSVTSALPGCQIRAWNRLVWLTWLGVFVSEGGDTDSFTSLTLMVTAIVSRRDPSLTITVTE